MANEKLCFKDYVSCIDNKLLSKTRKRMNKKSYKGRYYGGVEGDQSGAPAPSVSESLISEILNAALPQTFTANVLQNTPNVGEEEQEVTTKKIDVARQLFQALIARSDMSRQAIIQQFVDKIGVTQSTAVSYYERLAKEAGLTAKDTDKKDMITPTGVGSVPSPTSSSNPVERLPSNTNIDLELDDKVGEPVDVERAGVIRTVPNAHLIYKQQSEDGTFEELWIYNTGNEFKDELKIRREILAGTDIPPKKTKSPDGSQSYMLTSLGNAQFVHIKGLPN